MKKLLFIFTLALPLISERTQTMDLSDVQSFSVDSIPVILRSTPAFGEIVAFEITARGTVTAPKKAGEMELLLDTMGHGTPSYSKEAIDRIFTESGAAFGAEPRSDYVEVSMKCLKKFLPTVLPIMSEVIRVPLLTQEEIEISRSQLMSHLKSETDHPDNLLQLVLAKAFYKNHPYSLRPSGYLDTVPGITRDDLLALLSNLFNKQNILITVIGNLSKAEVENLVQTYFSKLPSGQAAAIVSEAPKNPVGEIIFEKKESPTTYFIAKFKAPSLVSPDYPALVLATEILQHRLFEEVRTKRGLTYSVSSAIGNSKVNSGYLYVTSTQLPEAVRVMFDEVKKLQTQKIDAETLMLQVRKFTSSWYLGREQASSQATIFALYELIGSGWQNSNSFIGRLEKITPDDVLRVANDYLKDFTYAVVGPEKPSLVGLPGIIESATPTPAPAATPSPSPAPKNVKKAPAEKKLKKKH